MENDTPEKPEKNRAAQELGRMGGRKRQSMMTPEQAKELARMGAAKRWAGHVKKGETLLMSEPVGQCSVCMRKTWVVSELGSTCNFPQPNGIRCNGVFHD